MATLPLRWQGRSRLARLRAEVEGRCARWLDEWSAAARDCAVEALEESAPADPRGAGGHWQELRAGAATARFSLPGPAFELWGQRLLGADGEADGLAEALGRRAFAALAQALLSAPQAAPARIERPHPRELEPRHGVAALALQLAGVRLRLYLDPAACDLLAPLPAPAPATLSPRAGALAQATVELTATLDLGRGALGQALNLRPGEILKTGLRLDAPLQLRAAGDVPVLSATLTQHEGARALRVVQLTASRTQETQP